MAEGDRDPDIAPRATYNGTTIARDTHGNALGGIRLPEAEVPTATNNAQNSIGTPLTSFSLFCGLLGSWTQFDSAKINTLYTDYGDYQDRFDAKADDVVAAGFVNADDLSALKETSARYTRVRPTKPALSGGSASPNNTGAFSVDWRGPAPAATATTYEVQTRDASGAGFSTVAGAGALAARSLSLSDFPEGTHDLKVRSTSTIPALHPDPQTVETTPFSDSAAGRGRQDRALRARSAPTCARLRRRRRLVPRQVTLSSADNGDPDLADGSPGSGVDPATVAASQTRNTTGSLSLADKVSDRAGNESGRGRGDRQGRRDRPALMLGCPNKATLGEPV